MKKLLTSTNEQTQFNSSIASLERLDELLRECNKLSRLCYYEGYNIEPLRQYKLTVLNLYKEISPKLETKETKRVNKIKQSYKTIKNITTKKFGRERNLIQEINIQQFNKHWMITNNLEILLRKLADTKGMLIIGKDLEDMRNVLKWKY